MSVASVVIPHAANTPQKIDRKIQLLKNYGLSEETSFAFMFACLGRGAGLHGEPNVESAIFKKHFPRTPLVGLFGNGEIGSDFNGHKLENLNEPNCKKKKDVSRLYHSYATVIILFSVS